MALALCELQFRDKLNAALAEVSQILEVSRHPKIPQNVDHAYEDKYLLAESLTNVATASQVNCLAALGLTREQLGQLCSWTGQHAVRLNFHAEELCAFDSLKTREVEGPKRVDQVSTTSSVFGCSNSTRSSKVVTKITEYFWKFDFRYELVAVRGVSRLPEDQLVIRSRKGSQLIKTVSKSAPYPEVKMTPATYDVNIGWLLQHIEQREEITVPRFRVDRTHAKCHTPRRNREIEEAIQYFLAFHSWAEKVSSYIWKLLHADVNESSVDLSLMSSEAIFVPVLPLFEAVSSSRRAQSPSAAEAPPATPGDLSSPTQIFARLPHEVSESALLPVADRNRLLEHEWRCLMTRYGIMSEALSSRTEGLITYAEMALHATLQHSSDVYQQYTRSIDYIESMLRSQLIAAIGKVLGPGDFAEYMQFHNRKLFGEAFAPVPFCFAVRQSEFHSPEGTVSICLDPDADPITTMVARGTSSPMQFALGASVNITFGGDRYLHAWLCHKFSDSALSQAFLVSRARQFSSMIVLVGRIASARVFEPKHAAIVQNKDELKMPLELSTIPTPKEFKDAISSLSPEQQGFAKAFRSMQLEGTLFGILVIQIKPQLEKVLNLPKDSLTKEIKLTQDLMQLFITHQIPSDLLSFDDTDAALGVELPEATSREKLEVVKGHTKAMYEMIDLSKTEQLEGRRLEAQFAQVSSSSGDEDDYDEGCGDEEMERCDFMPQVEEVEEIQVEKCRRRPATSVMDHGFKLFSSVRRGGLLEEGFKRKGPSADISRRRLSVGVLEAAMKSSASPGTSAQLGGQSAQAAQTAPSGSVQPQPARPGPGQRRPSGVSEASAGRDYTKVPRELDSRFEECDSDGVRPTIINPTGPWWKRSQKSLMAPPLTTIVESDEQKREKDAAFDLLDALTKSGALPIEQASLHIVVAATHCFDRTLMDTVIQDNVNPVEKVELSTLIMASTIHQKPVRELVREAQYPRIETSLPMLVETSDTMTL